MKKTCSRCILAVLCLLWTTKAFPMEGGLPELQWIPREPVLLMVFERNPSADAELFRRFQDEFLFATHTRSHFLELLSLTDLDPSLHVVRSVIAVFSQAEGRGVLTMVRTSRPDIAQRNLAEIIEGPVHDPSQNRARLYSTGDPSKAVALLEGEILVFGETDLVQESLDLYRAPTSNSAQRSRPSILSLDNDPRTDFQAIASPEWLDFDFRPETLASASIHGRSLCQSLEDIESLRFAARIASRVELTMKARAKDEEDAVVLSDGLDQFLVSSLAGSRPYPELHAAIQDARTERAQKEVRFSMPLDYGALKQLYHSETGRHLITWRLGDESREARQRIGAIIEAMAIGKGSHVADVGAGGGFFTVRLARAVGKEGRVYAEDIREAAVRSLEERVQKASLQNVEVVLGRENDPLLPEGALDAVLIVNAYHEMLDYPAMLAHIRRALKPGGRLVLVEPFDTSRRADTREAQMGEHILDPDLAEEELVEAGLEIVGRDDDFIATDCEECNRADWLIAARVSAPGGGKDNFPAGR